MGRKESTMEHLDLNKFRKALEGAAAAEARQVMNYRGLVTRSIEAGHDASALSWFSIYSGHVYNEAAYRRAAELLAEHTTEILPRPAGASNLFGAINRLMTTTLEAFRHHASAPQDIVEQGCTAMMTILSIYSNTVLGFDEWVHNLPNDPRVDDWDEDTAAHILTHFRSVFGHLTSADRYADVRVVGGDGG